MTDTIVTDLKSRARTWHRGLYYEDFALDQTFVHHWGRTLTEADNTVFTTLTLHYNPIYTNADFARAQGHAGAVVCPLLVFNTIFGLSVEDLSEIGGPFLGVDKMTHHRPVIVGETVYARSRVIDLREPKSRPDYGIVTWATTGLDETGAPVIEFERANLVRKRP